jgi:hypothetical protein
VRLLLLAASLAACADDGGERALERDAQAVAEGSAEAATAAERLAASGRAAIPAIETAFYAARIEGRLDLVVVLRRIGDAEAVPLLLHRARWDTDERVRKEAEWTLRGWAGGRDERAARARRAVRRLEESRADEKNG